MESKGRINRCGGAPAVLSCLLMLSMVFRMSTLSLTVSNVESVYEYVYYQGDPVSGNFVVVDHAVLWNSDHPGIDFTVTSPGANENTRKRVIFYTAGEYLLLALVSGLQVVYIRRLFGKSVAYGRV